VILGELPLTNVIEEIHSEDIQKQRAISVFNELLKVKGLL